MERCVFPDGVLFNIELNPRLWYAVDECLERTRALVERALTSASRCSNQTQAVVSRANFSPS